MHNKASRLTKLSQKLQIRFVQVDQTAVKFYLNQLEQQSNNLQSKAFVVCLDTLDAYRSICVRKGPGLKEANDEC